MTVSIYSLCSRASIFLGGEPISTFQDGSREAQVFGAIWQAELAGTVALEHWNFATSSFQCAQLNVTPTDTEYQYAYGLPADYVAIRFVQNAQTGEQLTDWAIEGGVLYTNDTNAATPILIEYVHSYDDSTVGTTPPWFQDLYAARLAVASAYPLRRKEDLIQAANAWFNTVYTIARTRNARESGPSRGAIARGSWLRAHNGYGAGW